MFLFSLYLKGGEGNKVLPIAGTDQYYWRATPATAIRKGDWKLIYYFEDKSVKLFNVAKDIGEENDLSRSYPDKASGLLDEIQIWLRETNAPIPMAENPVFRN